MWCTGERQRNNKLHKDAQNFPKGLLNPNFLNLYTSSERSVKSMSQYSDALSVLACMGDHNFADCEFKTALDAHFGHLQVSVDDETLSAAFMSMYESGQSEIVPQNIDHQSYLQEGSDELALNLVFAEEYLIHELKLIANYR